MTAKMYFRDYFGHCYNDNIDTLDAIRFANYYHETRLKDEGYAYFDGQLFPIGSKLTSKENGELMIAPEGTPDELIVGTVE